MKHIKLFLLLFCFCFIISSLANDDQIIEQFIAKDVDGEKTDFSFFYKNNKDSTFLIPSFLVNGHQLFLSTETYDDICLGVYMTTSRVYPISHGLYFVRHNILHPTIITNDLQTQREPMILSWNIHNQGKNSWHYSTCIYLAWTMDSRMNFFHIKQKGKIFVEIIQLLEEDSLSFALLVANHTSKKLVLTDLYGDGNQVKLKFPNGRVFTPSLKKEAKSIELKPGESKTFKIELDQLLKENKDFSMMDFEFGLTELVWEIKLDKEQTITRNFWLVKFNGELPTNNGSGYKLDGPLTLETFRDKKITALPEAKSYLNAKEDAKSETKETAGDKESSQK